MADESKDGSKSPAVESWQVEIERIRRLKPKGVLFLCVANSARSQLAEAIARWLAPEDMRVWSAGSRPTEVRPEAIAVLREVGIDSSGQYAKFVGDVPAGDIDVVFTLCAEEECPIFLGDALRVHWPLPDPAGESDNSAQAFREVRDDLMRRLRVLFAALEA